MLGLATGMIIRCTTLSLNRTLSHFCITPHPTTYQTKLGVPIALVHNLFAEKAEVQFGGRISGLLGAWHVSVCQIPVGVVKPTLTAEIKSGSSNHTVWPYLTAYYVNFQGVR